MSDLNRCFCYRTKGNSVDFESNAYKATVVVSLDHKGSTMTLDLDEFVFSDKVAAHADTVDKLLTGTAPTELDDATLRPGSAWPGTASVTLLSTPRCLSVSTSISSHCLRATISSATSNWRWTQTAKESSPSKQSARGILIGA
jgi:hypothetical protein